MSRFSLTHEPPATPEAKPAVALASLAPDQREYLRARGITDATIIANRLESARPQDLPRLAGRPVPEGTSGLIIPYPMLDSEASFCRIRWFPPLQDREGREVKFSQPLGTAPHLYIPVSVRLILPDPGVPLWIVEGETRALVCVQHGRPAVAIGGLWSWMADGRPIAELDAIACVDRELMLGSDSDTWVRPDLLQAVYALGKEMERRGAKVKVAVLRPAAGGSKRGLDDAVAAEGPGALDKLTAIPLTHKAFINAAAWWKTWRAKKDEAVDGTPATPVPPTPMAEADREEALALLRDPRLLLRIEEDLGIMGVVGEERVKVSAYLVGTSRKQSVGQGLAGTFKAGSAAGKNHIVRTVAGVMPEEDVLEFTYLSPKALFYLGENAVRHKVVICTEVAGRVEAEYAVRALISEPFITSAIPVKDEETGRFTTETFRVNGPIAYLDTTTGAKLNTENASRVFEFYLDEEEAQTLAIHRQQAREAGPERFQIEAERERVRRRHRNAQRLLEPGITVIIPFADQLTFPTKDRRARGDFPKLLALIRVIAFLHQFQREVKERDGRRYIEATPTDYALAHALACPTFEETLDVLDRRDRRLLDTILRNITQKVGPEGPGGVRFDRADVSGWTGTHRNHLVNPLNRLEEAEYLIRVEGGIGKKIIYMVNMPTVEADAGGHFGGVTPPEDLVEGCPPPSGLEGCIGV